jgi:hypothetical protein
MATEAVKISAIDIKKIWYGDTSKITATLTGATLAALLEDFKEVTNVHQDSWSLEESEASQDSYRNQLTGQVYRMGRKTPGDLTMKFTIGQYDYATKAEFLGGTATDTSWTRGREVTDIRKVMVALTYDGQYCVFPKSNITANEANSDKAIGLSITATAMEPDDTTIASEYWFDESVVKKA